MSIQQLELSINTLNHDVNSDNHQETPHQGFDDSYVAPMNNNRYQNQSIQEDSMLDMSAVSSTWLIPPGAHR